MLSEREKSWRGEEEGGPVRGQKKKGRNANRDGKGDKNMVFSTLSLSAGSVQPGETAMVGTVLVMFSWEV